MKTIAIVSTVPMLLRQLATAIPPLNGAMQQGYIAASDDDFWKQFTNAIDVKNSNLAPVVQAAATEDDVIILEAYAEWCGHCQRMAPVFDGAAKHFHDVGGLVLAKANCGDPAANARLCDDLGVRGFPTFYYGTADDFDDVRADPPSQLNELRSMTSTDEMINFLSERFSIDSDTSTNDDVHPTNDVNRTTAPAFTIGVDAYLSDIEKSTSDSLVQALVSTRLIERGGARDAFCNWQTWIADSHPSEKCRTGAREILDDMDEMWPAEDFSPATVRSNLLEKKQCLSDFSDVEYEGCATGGNPGAYTCGLWQTFHSMSVSPNSLLTGAQMFESLGRFIEYFFTCTVCQEHFLGMMKKVDSETVSAQDGFIIWLWEAHNEVNERLREEELDDGTFNVDRPKGLFPSPELCPKCLEDREGNYIGPYMGEHHHIGPFLDDFYGEDLVSGAKFLTSFRADEEESSGHRSFGLALKTSILVVSLSVTFLFE